MIWSQSHTEQVTCSDLISLCKNIIVIAFLIDPWTE